MNKGQWGMFDRVATTYFYLYFTCGVLISHKQIGQVIKMFN